MKMVNGFGVFRGKRGGIIEVHSIKSVVKVVTDVVELSRIRNIEKNRLEIKKRP